MSRQITITVLADDAARIGDFCAARGWTVQQGLAWLIGEGARRYQADQRTWDDLTAGGVPDDDPRKLELQRREAWGHLISMRVRTARTETEMAALRSEVAELGAAYKALRTTLMALQREQGVLRARLNPPALSGHAGRRSIWSTLRGLWSRRRG